MWRNRNRGLSLMNKRDCDEIMRQFLDINYEESVITGEGQGISVLIQDKIQVQSEAND